MIAAQCAGALTASGQGCAPEPRAGVGVVLRLLPGVFMCVLLPAVVALWLDGEGMLVLLRPPHAVRVRMSKKSRFAPNRYFEGCAFIQATSRETLLFRNSSGHLRSYSISNIALPHEHICDLYPNLEPRSIKLTSDHPLSTGSYQPGVPCRCVLRYPAMCQVQPLPVPQRCRGGRLRHNLV